MEAGELSELLESHLAECDDPGRKLFDRIRVAPRRRAGAWVVAEAGDRAVSYDEARDGFRLGRSDPRPLDEVLRALMPAFPDDATGDALRRLWEDGSDLERAHEVDVFVEAPTPEAAAAIARAARAHGWRAETDETTCTCTREIVPTHAAITALERELDALAEPHGGATDGWGTFALPTLVLNVAPARTAAELHERLATALRFPESYGGTWDAFWDCIGDPGRSRMPPILRLRSWDALTARLPDEAAELRRCLEEMPSARPGCRVEFES